MSSAAKQEAADGPEAFDAAAHEEGMNGDSLPESERKFRIKGLEGKSADQRRAQYRKIFQSIKRSRARFPDLSELFGYSVRRSSNTKDLRFRFCFTDIQFKIPDHGFEIRLQVGPESLLMIKQGAPADSEHPTLDRRERPYAMAIPKLGSVQDIKKHSQDGKKAPKSLRSLFEDGEDQRLFPFGKIESTRDKLVYYRPAEYKGKKYLVVLEIAEDEWTEQAICNLAEMDEQIELEVKGVIDLETDINVLKNPKEADLTEEEVQSQIAEPVLAAEAEFLMAKYNLEQVLTPKQDRMLRKAREAAKRPEGLRALEEARQRHLYTSIWEPIAA